MVLDLCPGSDPVCDWNSLFFHRHEPKFSRRTRRRLCRDGHGVTLVLDALHPSEVLRGSLENPQSRERRPAKRCRDDVATCCAVVLAITSSSSAVHRVLLCDSSRVDSCDHPELQRPCTRGGNGGTPPPESSRKECSVFALRMGAKPRDPPDFFLCFPLHLDQHHLVVRPPPRFGEILFRGGKYLHHESDCGSDEHLGAGDQLAAGRVVLTDPGLRIPQAVEMRDQFEIAVQGKRRVDPGLVHRREEDPELERCLISRLADCRKKRGNIGAAGPRSLSSGKVAVLTLLIFLSGQTSLHSKETVNLPVDESVQLEPSRLGEEISRTLEQKKYQWQLSRKSVEGESVSEKSWIALRLQEIASSARKAIRSFTNWFEEAWKKLMKRGLKSGGGDRNVDTKFLKELSSMASLALIVLIGGLVLWLMIALYRKHSGKEKIVVSDEGISGMIDLESSDIVATQLLEEEWMRLAREQIAKGEERLAVRALFLATLAHLGERGLLKIVRSKSNRDYRAELRVRSRNSGVIAAAFEENTTLFERVWYGVHHLGQGTVDYYLKNHETIAQESQRAGGQPQEAGR